MNTLAALTRQVDGNHYKRMKMQPIGVCDVAARQSNFAGGTMFKHLLRYPFKGEAVTDLEKALHYYDISREMDQCAEGAMEKVVQALQEFITANNTPIAQQTILRAAAEALETGARDKLEEVIQEEIQRYTDDTAADDSVWILLVDEEDIIRPGKFSRMDATTYYPGAFVFGSQEQASKIIETQLPAGWCERIYEGNGVNQAYIAKRNTPTWLEQVKAELTELDKKRTELADFLTKPRPSSVSQDEWARLQQQAEVMSAYAFILSDRIIAASK